MFGTEERVCWVSIGAMEFGKANVVDRFDFDPTLD